MKKTFGLSPSLFEKFNKLMNVEFLRVVQQIRDETIIADLERAIERRDVGAVLAILNVSPETFAAMGDVLRVAFQSAGDASAKPLPRAVSATGARTVFRFDARNVRAEAWLREHSSTLVTRVASDVRDGLRQRLETGMMTGDNPRRVALDMVGRINPVTKRRSGGIIGLSGPQERWVANARVELASSDTSGWLNRKARDKRFDKYVRSGEPIPVVIQQKMIARYNDNLLKLRGETIARTEMISTLNRGQYESYQQAIEKGVIRQSAIKKIWDSASDARVRDSHATLDGITVDVNEPFVSPATGASLMFPGDSALGAKGADTINCRCRVRYAVDFLKR